MELATGCFMLSCCLTSSLRFRTPLLEFSESNLSVLFMLPVLMKCVKDLLMYSSFLLSELLVSSLSCIATYSLQGAFTFSWFQSCTAFLTNVLCWEFWVFCSKCWEFCSSKFRSIMKLSKAVELNRLSNPHQSINFVSSFTKCYLHCLMEGGGDSSSREPYVRMPHLYYFHTLQMTFC